eukprot:5877492-Amphidinium_carterae.1
MDEDLVQRPSYRGKGHIITNTNSPPKENQLHLRQRHSEKFCQSINCYSSNIDKCATSCLFGSSVRDKA